MGSTESAYTARICPIQGRAMTKSLKRGGNSKKRYDRTAHPRALGLALLMPWGSCRLDVETRGSPPLAPPPRVCGEDYLTLPYLTLPQLPAVGAGQEVNVHVTAIYARLFTRRPQGTVGFLVACCEQTAKKTAPGFGGFRLLEPEIPEG